MSKVVRIVMDHRASFIRCKTISDAASRIFNRRPNALIIMSARWRSIKNSDDAVPAPLYLTLHDGSRAWMSFDWDAMNRLHVKGFISG
jgi:hypothetical protein